MILLLVLARKLPTRFGNLYWHAWESCSIGQKYLDIYGQLSGHWIEFWDSHWYSGPQKLGHLKTTFHTLVQFWNVLLLLELFVTEINYFELIFTKVAHSILDSTLQIFNKHLMNEGKVCIFYYWSVDSFMTFKPSFSLLPHWMKLTLIISKMLWKW